MVIIIKCMLIINLIFKGSDVTIKKGFGEKKDRIGGS